MRKSPIFGAHVRIRAALVLSVLTLALRASAQEGPPTWDPGRTYVFFAGVREWRDPSLGALSKEKRQDRALECALKADGVPPENMVFLEDEEATRDGMRLQLTALAQRAKPGSMLIVYYSGQGIHDASGTYLANYDIDPARPAETGFALGDIESALATGWRGARLLLLADCNHAGALARTAASIGARAHVKAASMTSSMASNGAADCTTFTESLAAILAGDASADLDRNGVITFAEADEAVRRAMRFREGQLARATRCTGFEENFVLRATGPAGTLPCIDGAWQLHEKVECNYDGRMYPAEIIDARGADLRVHYTGYPASQDEWVLPARVRKLPCADASVGEVWEVEWKGKWFGASVTAKDGGFFLIHYDGFGPEWDEWVPRQRMRLKEQK